MKDEKAVAPLQHLLWIRRNHNDLWHLLLHGGLLLHEDDRFRSEAAALAKEGTQSDNAGDSDYHADDESRNSATVNGAALFLAVGDAHIHVGPDITIIVFDTSAAPVAFILFRQGWAVSIVQVGIPRVGVIQTSVASEQLARVALVLIRTNFRQDVILLFRTYLLQAEQLTIVRLELFSLHGAPETLALFVRHLVQSVAERELGVHEAQGGDQEERGACHSVREFGATRRA